MLDFRGLLKEVAMTTLPVVILIFVLDTLMVGATAEQYVIEFISCFIVIFGFTPFLYGVDIGIIPMGKAIGLEIAKRKSVLSMILVVFVISMVVTVAEPDVMVFSTSVCKVFETIDQMALVISIALGVAAFLVLASVRMIFGVSLRVLFTLGYLCVIIFGLLVPTSILGIAFDSGGVTTGPVTIPVLMAMGLGIGMAVLSKNNGMDSFGMIGLASIGPLIFVMAYGMLAGISGPTVVLEAGLIIDPVSIEDTIAHFVESTRDALISIVPLYAIFLILQKYYLHCTWRDLWIMSWGVLFAIIGMIMFLTGVYSGFMPLAQEVGAYMIHNDAGIWILVLGLVVGYLVIIAEPSMRILGKQVETVSKGVLTNKLITLVVGAGVSLFVGVGMYVMSQGWMSIYYILPIYALAIILVWLMDKDLVGVAYDAGGVATGPMSVAIIMSMYTAMAQTAGSEIAAENAFGVIALIALSPIIALSVLGVVLRVKKMRQSKM